MTARTRNASLTSLSRAWLLRGTSGGAFAVMLAATPAQAQLANLGGALGHTVNLPVQVAPTSNGPRQVISPTMAQIGARHEAYRARVGQQASIIANANVAARAAALNLQQTISNGLRGNGLRAVDVTKQNTSALTIWVGAEQPIEKAPTTPTQGITVQVDVKQTQSRALLSWDSFNIGSETLLNFDQQGNKDWVVVNRVVGAIDPNTGRIDPSKTPTPTQILGQMKADGTVYVLDRSGILFGANSQVNLRSLVASSLELGRTIGQNPNKDAGQPAFVDLSLATINSGFLQNGILPSDHVGLLGSVKNETHGAVTVATGARITSGGGFVIIAAPKVSMSGEINSGRDAAGNPVAAALGGQVSLVAGKYVDASVSTGSADSIDPNVRGLIVTSQGGGTIDMGGSINAPQGYISLVTDVTGTVNVSGILTSTTGVSRNGKISLIGGAVNLISKTIADADGNAILDSTGAEYRSTATLSIVADLSGATIPQAAASVAAFKTSQIDIGAIDVELGAVGFSQLQSRNAEVAGRLLPTLLPSLVNIGDQSMIYAPSANVNVGGYAGGPKYIGLWQTGVSIGSGAVIDVSGLDAVQLAASRNQIEISPTKKNELRDTPIYRDTRTDGGFTLNGATLYIDPRLSGVRADGVAWVGSPLIEAGSLADQIGVTAPELMTKGGNVTLSTFATDPSGSNFAIQPSVNIAASATIDFSGGWVNYQSGAIRTTKLITSDGRVVDIGSADPNDVFVGIANGFVENLPQLVAPRVFANALLVATHFEEGYSEGRDAGSLNISAPTGSFNASLFGQSVAGARQILNSAEATAASRIAGDPRLLQAVHNQMPTGGLLRFSASLGGSVLVGGRDVTLADGSAGLQVGANQFAATNGLIHILDSTINTAGLAALTLETSGSTIFASDSKIELNAGGVLSVRAGRAISFNGTISVPSGTIDATTYGNRLGDFFDAGDDFAASGVAPITTAAWTNILANAAAPGVTSSGWFDIAVNGGAILSTRGLWTNDLLVTDDLYRGRAYTSGGSISLNSAPRIAAFSDASATRAVDLSGSILLASGSLLDVSGGGFLSRTGELDLSGRGGNVTLSNATTYFQIQQVDALYKGNTTGTDLFNSDLSSFKFSVGSGYDSAIVPDELTSKVDIAADTIRGFGFQGGGTFTLTTPDLNFGNSGGTGTQIGLDFLEKTGFATLNLSAWNTKLIDNVFDNGRVGKTGLLSTEIIRIGANDRLNLTQSVLPTILTTAQITTLRNLADDSDVSRLSDFTPTNQLGDFNNRAANLVLGGLTELDVLGGTITGAAGATITVPKLYQGGTIDIRGGSITQREILPFAYVSRTALAVGQQINGQSVDDVVALAAIFGPANAAGKYSETGFSADPRFSTVLNRDLVSKAGSDRQVYYLGRLAQDDGIVFAAGSNTDLSGAVLLNPLAPVQAGAQIRAGRLIDGGIIQSAGRYIAARNLFGSPTESEGGVGYRARSDSVASPATPSGVRPARLINAETGALIDISGAVGIFDVQGRGNSLLATTVWSNGGGLAGLGGGNVSLATILASGGAAGAHGGTFDWYNAVLRQNASSVIPVGAGSANIVFAEQLMRSGFDSFSARGTLTTLGDVTLRLGRSFILQSAEALGSNDTNSLDYYSTIINATGDLTITAPHIRLSSIRQFVSNLPQRAAGTSGDHLLTLRAEAVSGTGASFDIVGAIGIDSGISNVSLSSQGDIRLTGVQPILNTIDPTGTLQVPSLSGGIIAAGRLTMQARSINATTGTGNLLIDPKLLGDNISTYTGPFLIASLAKDLTDTPTVTFRNEPGTTPITPYSAGSYIRIIGENILQAGALYAPIGRIDLGSRTPASLTGFISGSISTSKLVLAAGSVTSVSGNGLSIPYGTTTDLTDYFFLPTLTAPISRLPVAELGFSAADITTEAGATVDASGGGNLYAYEFVSGTGGSRDVLSRFNADPYSGNNGFQYADGRQIYAILPADSPQLAALFDPIYASDYASLYGAEVGKTVTLDAVAESAPGANDGLAGGAYVLLPAKYALLPGARRLVENVGAVTPIANSSGRDTDGSINVGGTYGIGGTGISDPLRKSFVVQSQAVFKRYSQIVTGDVGDEIATNAVQSGLIVPRLPNDAARIVIDPGTGLTIGNRFDTRARASASGRAGRGSQVDILGDIINIVSSEQNAASTGVNILTESLINLDAASLLIGGRRTDRADGTTAVAVTASEIHVRNFSKDAAVAGEAIALSAPELIFAVDNSISERPTSVLDIASNAVLSATGALVDTRDGVYDLTSATLDPKVRMGALGSFIRLANGPERFVSRQGDLAPSAKDGSTLKIGAATFSGQSLLIDASNHPEMDAANLLVDKIALSSDSISFSTRKTGVAGFVISPELEAKLAAIAQVTLVSTQAIGFTPGVVTGGVAAEHQFKNLVIDAPGIRLIRSAGVGRTVPLEVTVNANNVTLRNSFEDTGSCTKIGVLACGASGNSLIINAAGSLTLGSGTFRTYGFESKVTGQTLLEGSVSVSAAGGTYYSGKGSLELGNAAFRMTTPFIVELGTSAVPKEGTVQPNYAINTINSVTISAPAGAAIAVPQTPLAPGARFAIGSLTSPTGSLTLDDGALAKTASIAITDTLIRATAGTIDLVAQDDLSLGGTAALLTPSYQKTFGADNDPDQVTVSASGGNIGLTTKQGDIALGTQTRLAIGGTAGGSGSIALFASRGQIALGSTIEAGSPQAGGNFAYDAGGNSFDLGGFVDRFGAAFTGHVAIRTGVGDLTLGAGNAYRLADLTLVADGGSTRINRTIDTSGVNGGNIALYGRDAVVLEASAVLDSHSTGYAMTDTRQARAGNISLGVGDAGAISVLSGARLDLGVARSGARLVPKQQVDPLTGNQITTYTLVQSDIGGKLLLRAPVIEQIGADTVDISFAGNVSGASDVSVVGYKRYDLAALAQDALLTGVKIVNGVATLDPSAAAQGGKINFLTDETSAKAIPYFIQNFDISGANANLGMLPGLGATFHAKAGVDIDYAGDIVLASSWNLGAGYITDYAAASAGSDPDLLLSKFSIIEGRPVYEVAAGKEAHLFQNFVHMLYRTGAGANTGGEAGVFTFRAGGDLDIKGSISDGFFNFADQTDAAYLTYQLHGGKLLVNPTYQFKCAANSCASLGDFDVSDDGIVPTIPRLRDSINIGLNQVKSTLIDLAAPYSDTANSASAFSHGMAGGGDPYGGASLFPLLADGSAASSSDIQLVGGAGAFRSANPLHIDRGSDGSVIIEGETSYTLKAPRAKAIFAGEALLKQAGSNTSFSADELTAQRIALALGLDLTADNLGKATRINFGQASNRANKLLIAAAEAFVALHESEARMIGPAKKPTGLATTLELAVEFMKSSGALDLLAQSLEGAAGPGVGGRFAGSKTITTRTLVRTGTGSIDIAAAADIDLTNGPAVLRNDKGGKGGTTVHPLMQLGGTAVYTAGHRVNPSLVTATVVGTGQSLVVDPTAYLPSNDLFDLKWRPDISGQLQANPVFADGGGSVSLEAGNDILGRRDVWAENSATRNPDMTGGSDQAWRVGKIGTDQDNLLASTYIRINAQQFGSGVGALGGGNVSVRAGGDLSEMTIALDTTLASADIGDSFGAMIFGGGNLDVYVGGNINGGRFDIASGTASLRAGEDIGSLDYLAQLPNYSQGVEVTRNITRTLNLPEIRLTDAQVALSAGGSITLAKVGALGLQRSDSNSQGLLTPISALEAQSFGDFTITGGDTSPASPNVRILPGSLEVTTFGGDVDLGTLNNFLYPSAQGQLSLLAAGTLRASAINLDDGDASYLPGLYSAHRTQLGDSTILTQGREFGMPGVFPNTADARRRLYHNAAATHAGDDRPARIIVGGSLIDLSVYSAKQIRISAGEDILNMIFVGQNVNAGDSTRIRAGRDITGTNSVTTGTAAGPTFTNGRKIVQGNYFALGGPGSFFVEAGRDLGPFLNSATISSYFFQAQPGSAKASEPVASIGNDSYAGGIIALGNDFNPWLAPKSADIYAFFGVAKGMNFTAVRETYLNPANVDALPGDLFETKPDNFGNTSPDRTKPIYAPILIEWMKANESAALIKAYGTADVTAGQAYTAFAALPDLTQRRFLLDKVYFPELSSPSDPAGNSYLQYERGYRAVETLFPASFGYTKNVLDGSSNGGERVLTGNLDLRLATIETTRDSNVTILGPGGNALLGSVVRTSTQAAGLAYQPQIFGADFLAARPTTDGASFQVGSIPIGYEGILTLRGGSIHSFTDGDLRLNQSRLFSQQSGNIVLWSSNGDLNAGQGPKSAANVPPIVLRFNPDGGSEVDSAGAVVGAGIAGFAGIRRFNSVSGRYELVNVLDDADVAAAQAQLLLLARGATVTINGKSYTRDVPTIYLLAPAGTVDAGDAGVRASGDIFVAAAQVANADNFKVGGTAIGIPALTSTAAPALPASAASALVANVFKTSPTSAVDQRSRIFVDVLGYFNSNSSDCLDDQGKPKDNCESGAPPSQ